MEPYNDLISSDSNFYLSSNKFQNQTYRTAKLFSVHPPNLPCYSSMTDLRQGFNFKLKTTKYIFPKFKKKIKPNRLDPELLKSDLISHRSKIQSKKNELNLLKIKYNKLLMDNIYNKTLLAKVLEIPMSRGITKDMVFLRIKHCKLSPQDKLSLQQAHEILKLKLDIENKKKLLQEKNIYKNHLEKNSKRKIVSNLENEFFIKCEQQRSLLNTLENLEKKFSKFEKKLDEEDEKLKNENLKNERLIDKEVQWIENIQKMLDEKFSLMKQINQYVDRIKKLDKTNNDKEKEIKEEEKKNTFDENKVNVINNYKSYLSEESDIIQQKKKLKEESENLLKDSESEMNSLQKEYDKLYSKMLKYRDEKPKLLRKANEPRKDIEKKRGLKKGIR